MFNTPFTNVNNQGVLGEQESRRAGEQESRRAGEQEDHRDSAPDQQECGRGLIKNSVAGIEGVTSYV
jgi:hypothetical protein